MERLRKLLLQLLLLLQRRHRHRRRLRLLRLKRRELVQGRPVAAVRRPMAGVRPASLGAAKLTIGLACKIGQGCQVNAANGGRACKQLLGRHCGRYSFRNGLDGLGLVRRRRRRTHGRRVRRRRTASSLTKIHV